MFARTISTPLETDQGPDRDRPQRMDRQRSSRIEKAREFVRRELQDMQLPSSCATAPQVDAEQCALTFAPENEDPDQVWLFFDLLKNLDFRLSASTERGENQQLGERKSMRPFVYFAYRNCRVKRVNSSMKNTSKTIRLIWTRIKQREMAKRIRGIWGRFTQRKGLIFRLENESYKKFQPCFQYGSVFLSFWSKKAAFLSFRLLQEEMPNLRLNILPNINSKLLCYGSS